jgi:hypothetical protein
MATVLGEVPVAKSILEAKELAVIEPEVLVFLKTETVLLTKFVTTISGLPSPSTSPIATLMGSSPVVKSTLGAKELAVMEPEALVFLKTETVPSLTLVTTRSGLPSPSTSLMAAKAGPDPVVKSNFGAKDEVSIIFELGKVRIKGVLEYAVNPFVVTEID